jgi:hypothetical protein
LQEQVDREALAIAVKASKLTGRVLAKVFTEVLRRAQKEYRAAQTPKGRQPVKKLMNHNEATSTIPLDGETRLFDRAARQFNVDYSFHKTGKGKYLLLFKAKQADAITAAFSEYTKLYMKRANDKRPPIAEQVKKAAERAFGERPKHKEHTRKREAVRE